MCPGQAWGPVTIRDLLSLDPEKHGWITRRWVVLGDPGAGKTTGRWFVAALRRARRSAEGAPGGSRGLVARPLGALAEVDLGGDLAADRFPSTGADFVELELLAFDEGQRREFLARWFGRADSQPDLVRAERGIESLAASRGLWELAGNPLYLTLMALLFEEGKAPSGWLPGDGIGDRGFRVALPAGPERP